LTWGFLMLLRKNVIL